MTHLVFDMDFIIFDAVSVAEERFIVATHKPTGRKIELDNKTALYGHYKKKDGGWIAEENKRLGNDYWKVEDFEIIEGQRPRPFKILGYDEFSGERDESKDYFISPWEGARKILDDKIKAICKTLGTNSYTGFTGTGNVFRHDFCTLLYYKDRDDLMKPLLLKRMKEYVCERHSCTLVETIEADDAFSIAVHAGYDKWKKGGKKDADKVIGVAVDKDAKQIQGWHFNPNKDKEPRLIEGFGELWLDSKGDVDGKGRLWLYFQSAAGDGSDNYSANCFSDKSWGPKSAYKELKDCKDDKQAFEALVKIYKNLYPEKKTVLGCKGEIEIDAIHVLQENFNLAKMMRTPDEKLTDIRQVLSSLNITH